MFNVVLLWFNVVLLWFKVVFYWGSMTAFHADIDLEIQYHF